MQLSFVIPAHNEETLIGACIASITSECKRTGIRPDMIVANNASTDRTEEIALASGARVVEEMRKGTGWARQAGYRAASGDLIACIDADSTLTAGWIAYVLKQFDNDPSLAAISGPYTFEHASIVVRFFVWLYYQIAVLLHVFNTTLWKRGTVMQGGNMVIRRLALDAIGGFNTAIEFYGDDTDMARRLSAVGRVKFDLHMVVYSSPRRLESEGLVGASLRYIINHAWIIFFGKPFHAVHKDVRTAGQADMPKR
jgi:cellulose synthase/poly-beta-1,6-N-acetylglucosamine synthase-like glycosyltransferase